MSGVCRAMATTAARSASRSIRRRASPSFDSTSSTDGQRRPVGCRAPVVDVDEPLRHPGTQFLQLAGEDDTAVIDDDDVLAQILDQVELVAGEQHRRAGAGDIGEQLGHEAHGDRVETGERLVEHEQVGLVDQGGDQLDALLVAVRQGVDAVPGPVGEVETIEPRVDTPATSLLVRPHSSPR